MPAAIEAAGFASRPEKEKRATCFAARQKIVPCVIYFAPLAFIALYASESRDL